MPSEWLSGRSTQLFDRSFPRSYSYYAGPGGSGWHPYHSTTTVMKLLIGANALVFGAWVYGEQTRNTPLLRRLTDSFTLSLRNLKEGRTYTLLTSAFSHRSLAHIAFNMFSLWTFGRIIGFAGVGGVHAASLCLTSGIAGSAAWAYHHAFIKPDPRQAHRFGRNVITSKDLDTAIGASGLVMGAGAAAACLFPRAPINIMFIPVAIPLWGATLGFFALDAYFLNSTTSGFGHAAHMGGAVAGVAYYLLALRGYGGVWRMAGRWFR